MNNKQNIYSTDLMPLLKLECWHKNNAERFCQSKGQKLFVYWTIICVSSSIWRHDTGTKQTAVKHRTEAGQLENKWHSMEPVNLKDCSKWVRAERGTKTLQTEKKGNAERKQDLFKFTAESRFCHALMHSVRPSLTHVFCLIFVLYKWSNPFNLSDHTRTLLPF